MATMMNCPYCGKLTDPRLNACVHCHAPMRRSADAVVAATGAPAGSPAVPFAPRNSAKCPNCNTPVKQGDIICVKCGTNLLTGQQVVVQPQAVAAARSGGGLLRFGAVIVVLLVVFGGICGSYYVFVYNEPIAKAKRLAGQGNLLEAVQTLNEIGRAHV